jgi:hypothetical protein
MVSDSRRCSQAADRRVPTRLGLVMPTLSALLLENGLPNLPALLIEPHRNPGGVWRIKFSYEAGEPLSMSADQASTMVSSLHELGETELADEIDGAIKSAVRYETM